MSYNIINAPELAAGVIQKYSDYIAAHKPATFENYFHPSCLQCYFLDPHPAHPLPPTLVELHAYIQTTHVHLSSLKAQQVQHWHETLRKHEARLSAYGKAEIPLEVEIRRIDRRSEAEANDLAKRKATLMSRVEFDCENARMEEGKERRREARERLKADWDVLKAELGEWYQGAEKEEEARLTEHQEKVMREIDAMRYAQVLLDENINWVRKTFESLREQGMELPFPL